MRTMTCAERDAGGKPERHGASPGTRRVDARPLGLPFPFAWHVFWILATFGVLILVDRALGRGDARGASRDEGLA